MKRRQNPIPPQERMLVTLAEAADLLSISLTQLRRIINQGELRASGAGKLRRVRVDELRRWDDERSEVAR